jgi:hypothetical protein
MERLMSPHPAIGSASQSDASPLTIQQLLTNGRPTEAEIEAENVRLKMEVDRIGERQREVMELLRCNSPERIVHDLRNLINELNLYRQLVESMEQ